jgi:hypothetical protein
MGRHGEGGSMKAKKSQYIANPMRAEMPQRGVVSVAPKPFDLVRGQLMLLLDNSAFSDLWRLVEISDISTEVVVCTDVKCGFRTSFTKWEYRFGNGVRKVAT